MDVKSQDLNPGLGESRVYVQDPTRYSTLAKSGLWVHIPALLPSCCVAVGQ